MSSNDRIAESFPERDQLKTECVWDYPRPRPLEPTDLHVKVYFGEDLIAATQKGFRLLETSHPPTYYFPREDVCMDRLSPVAGGSFCEYKGRAQYFNIKGGETSLARGAWSYPSPTVSYSELAQCIAFYAAEEMACWVGPEKVKSKVGISTEAG